MRTNLILLAGQGKRFADAGYRLPKPLIPVSGQPMILRAIAELPPADKWLFVVRQEHLRDYSIDRFLKKAVPGAVVVVDPAPRGQVTSCLEAAAYLQPDDSVFVAACDDVCLYQKREFEQLTKTDGIDAIIWTFTKQETLSRTPAAYSWCQLENDGQTISRISLKVPISSDPFNDHAIVASFFFRRAADFLLAAKAMVKARDTVNGEFYLDGIPMYLKKINKRSVIFDVDLYVGWGKPDDLHYYDYMEYSCRHIPKTRPACREAEDLFLWRRYFRQHPR